MMFKHIIALLVFVVCVSVIANEQDYAQLNQSYMNTLELLDNAGVKYKEPLPNPITSQRLSEFRYLLASFSTPATLKDYQKKDADSIFSVKPRHNAIPFQLASAKSYMTGPGNSVVPYSGEFIDVENDLSLPSRGGIGFSLVRTYSSYNKSDIGLGVGWRHNYDIWISRNTDTVALHLNSRDVFFHRVDGKWVSGQGDFYSLQEPTPGVFYVLTPDLTRYTFEASDSSNSTDFRLSEIASRHGKWARNVINIFYRGKSHHIDFITDPFGNKIDFYYDGTGHLTAVVSPFSYVTYSYDGDSLIQVNYPNRKNFIGNNEQHVKYRYNKTFLTNKQSAGMTFEFVVEYDEQMRVSVIGSVSGNDRSKTWTFSYSNKKTIVDAPFPTPQTIYTFNSAVHPSLPTKIEQPALEAVSSLEFNSDGLLIKKISPIGRIDVYEYDTKNNNRLFQANQLAERSFPADGAYADFSEKGLEYRYHPEIALPVEIIYYQYENGKRHNVKTEKRSYQNKDLTLSEQIESGRKTRYWQNVYGEPAITLNANNCATIYLYSTDCVFQAYEFKDGDVNNSGYLCKKIVTDDVTAIEQHIRSLGASVLLAPKKRSVRQEVQYSYNTAGKLIRSKNALSDNFSIVNSYGDIIYSYSNEKGVTVSQYTPWGSPLFVLHQFEPCDNDLFGGENVFGINGIFYRERFEYDNYTLLYKHFATNEPIDSDENYAPFIYERYPSGTTYSITTPEGITRIDDRNKKTGLLEKQYVQAKDKEIALLNSDFTYYPGGILKSVKDHLGGVSTRLLDGYGNVYAEITPLGVTTQKQINVLGQETATWSYKDEQELARTEYIYNDNNLLDIVRVFCYYENNKEIIDAQKYIYDDMGNVIAQRGIQEGSWTYYLYDGLDRQIASLSPSGDIKLSFWGNSLPYCEMTNLHNQSTGKTQLFGIYYEYDDCGRKKKEIPVTNWGKLEDHRAIEYCYDVVGNQTKIVSTGLSSTEKTFNTIGKITSEKQKPLSTKGGETASEATYRYNSAGQLIEKKINNEALAIVDKKSEYVPEHKSAPQITKYYFDSLGRSIKTIQPDGLVEEKTYDSHSLPIKMRWFYEFEPAISLRSLDIQYSVLGQCLSVKDSKTGTIIRQYAFDLLGNCIQSVDIDWQGKEITLIRKYDSLGTKREETVRYGDMLLPTQIINYDLKAGIITKIWQDLRRPSLKYWEAETFQMDAADRLDTISLDHSNAPFASWNYLGTLPTARIINESGVSNHITYNDFLEPEEQVIQRTISGQIIGKVKYGYGPQGQAEFSSSRLISENTGKNYDFSTYSSFDSFRRLVAQNTEQFFPAESEWTRRAKENLDVPSQNNLQALQTQRMKYDQANNIWVMYNGDYFDSSNPTSFTEKQNPLFISSARPIVLNNGKVQDMDLRELASNRDVTTAYLSGEDNKIEVEVQKNDKLGCLVEFEGTYWNGIIRRPAIWKLTYDSLGRLTVMKGYAPEDSTFDNVKKDSLLAELHFSYDSENRRICKEVLDYCSHKKKNTTITVYTDIHQSLVFDDENGKISLREQYLWNPNSQELLMAAMPEQIAQGKNATGTRRYYFQQDKGYNIIFTSSYENSNFVTVSAMSYFGFGDNATRSEITEIRSSETERNRRYAYDKTLQNVVPGCWYASSKQLHYIELQLAGNDNLSALKIWAANKIPESFAVFVLSPYQHLPSANSLRELVPQAKENLAAIVENGKYYNKTKMPSWETPYNIPLLDKKGDRIIIVWEKSCDIEVREFEVTKAPNNPGAIAFAGQWLDRETDMYYQINRYRLAGANKFISPDPLGYFDGINLYAYAHNNPLEWHDPDGRWAHIILGAGIGAILGGGMYALNCWMNGTEFDWAEFAVSVFAGAVSGAIAAALLPVNPILAGFVAGAVGGAIAEGGITYIRTGDWEKSLIAAGKGAIWGGAAGAFAGGLGIFGGSSSNFMAGLLQSTGVGALTGGVFGGARQAFDVYCETGDWSTAFYAAQIGAGQGAIMGGVAAASGYSLSRLIPMKNHNIAREKPGAVDQTQNNSKLGGKYGELDTSIEEHGHHMPAKSASPLNIEDGPAILMDAADHRQTASYGSSNEAKAYRALQQQLIERGDFKAAFEMDVADIHLKFGNKYDAGIAQAREYLNSIPNIH